MANLWDQLRKAAGNFTESIGNAIPGLPEMGVSEWIAGGPTRNTAAYASENLTSYDQPNMSVMNYSPFIPSRSVRTPTGGGGGSYQRPRGENPYITTPPNADGGGGINLDAIFAPAYEALSQYEATLPGYEAQQTESAQLAATGQKAGLQAEEASRMGEFAAERQQETGRTESAIGEARRQAAELLQGLQARYGGTTGTGRFASEILGSQTTKNIAINRAALQDTLSKISAAENTLKNTVLQESNKIDMNLQNGLQQLREWLQNQRASIAQSRTTLATEKATQQFNLVNNYQQYIYGLNQQAAKLRNQLALKWEEGQNKLNEIKAAAHLKNPADLEAFRAYGMPLGDTGRTAYYYPDIKGYRTTVTGANEDEELSNPFGV
jgi:hypothetical protein